MINKRFTVQDIAKFDLKGRIESLSSAKNVLGAGAVVGGMKTVTDEKSDTLQTTAVNVAAGAGAAYGVKYVAGLLNEESAKKLTDQAQKKANELPKREAVKGAKVQAAKIVRTDNRLTVSRIQARDLQEMYKQPGTPASYNTKKYQEAQDKAHATKQKMKKAWGGAKVAGVAGLGAFALASVMDTSESLSEDKHTSRMVKQQEERLTKKQTKERREQNKQGYGNIDMGQMAIDLFNERTGHHKMGNAKFQ